jgi:hypothetical protein
MNFIFTYRIYLLCLFCNYRIFIYKWETFVRAAHTVLHCIGTQKITNIWLCMCVI